MTSAGMLPLAAMITQLCDAVEHREPYVVQRRAGPVTRYHVTTTAPLIDQLLHAASPSRSTDAGPSTR